MHLLIFVRLHVLHPDLAEEDLVIASEHSQFIALNDVQVCRDLLNQSVGLETLQNLLLALNKLVDV